MEEQQIIERIDKFFDKEGLEIQGKYFLTKKMNEEYWEEIQSEGEEEEDLLGALGEEEPETEIELAPPEDIKQAQLEELEKRKQRDIKKQGARRLSIKKPKIKAKKENTESEIEDEIV